MTEKAIVVTSGGMDSTTAVYWAKHVGYDVECMSFDYGQRHFKELEFAERTANKLKLPWHQVDLQGITKLIDSSALTNPDIEVPEGHYAQENMSITVVPNRNAVMMNIAIARAVAVEASAVVTGVHAGDHAVYPDCRPEFIEALQKLALVANEGFVPAHFTIMAPFLHMTKAQIASMGNNLSVPWEDTWTCYKGGEIHCGRCSTCVERLEAFDLASVVDPSEYEDREYWKTVV